MYFAVIGGFWTTAIRQASYTVSLEAITHSSISNNNCAYFELYKNKIKTLIYQHMRVKGHGHQSCSYFQLTYHAAAGTTGCPMPFRVA